MGVDRGLHEAGVVNVIHDPTTAKNRILRLLDGARRRVCVQGISLHSFFSRGELFFALSKLVERPGVAVKCLILDPESTQAKYRAYREQLFVDPTMTFAQFQADTALYENSALSGKMHTSRGRFPTILGKEMPVIEYGQEQHAIFQGDPMRRPLGLLEDHFEFAFDSARGVPFPPAGSSTGPSS